MHTLFGKSKNTLFIHIIVQNKSSQIKIKKFLIENSENKATDLKKYLKKNAYTYTVHYQPQNIKQKLYNFFVDLKSHDECAYGETPKS